MHCPPEIDCKKREKPFSFLKKNLAFFTALGNLGNVLTQKGRLTEAESAFKQALKFRRNMADTHYNL